MSWTRGRWTMVSMLLATPVISLALAICALAQVVTITVTDTIYRADGSPAGGTVIVSWPAFTTASGQAVAAGSTSATIGASGVLSLPLTPNAGATPLGTYYTAVYHLDNGSVNREYWVVPASSSPVHISAIRSTVLPTSVAMQTVSKSYVDTAIAAAVAGHPLDISNPYVLKSGDTMTGPLTLPGDPTAPAQAATKGYVDTTVAAANGGVGQKVAMLPSATQTVTQPTGTQLQANRLNGVEYASQYQNGSGGNGIVNALASTDCASGCEVKAEQNYTSNETYTATQWNDGTHVEDKRKGGRRDTYLNPENAITPGTEAGQVVSVTSTRPAATVYQLTNTQNPASVGVAIDHKALAGGSNQLVQGIGAIPYNKSAYSALTVNGTYNTQGKHVLTPKEIDCFGVGDCLIGSQVILSSGGSRDNADEGAHPFDLQIHEDSRVFTGACTSGCSAGSTSVTIAAATGAGTQGDGRFLINTNPAKVISAGTLTGIGAAGPSASAGFSGTSFPVSTFFRIAAAIPSQASNVAPGTVTVAIATTGLPSGFAANTAAAPASSGVACLADPSAQASGIENFETANYTVVDGTHLQLTLNKAHFANATVAIGGLCGYGLEQTVDTANGIRQVFPVIGSYSSTGLYYAAGSSSIVGVMEKTSAYVNTSLPITSAVRSGNTVTLTTAGNMNYDLNGLAVTVSGIADSSFNGSFTVTTTSPNTLTYTQSGADSSSTGGTIALVTGGYKLYPMAEVLSVFNPATKLVDGQMTLAPNTVAWAANDTVEQPHYHQQKIGPDVEFVGQTTPRPSVSQQAGVQYDGNNGPGLLGWSVINAAPASNYFGSGGTHTVPDAAYLSQGAWKRTMVAQAGEQSVFTIHCNSHGCGKWNSGYNLFELDSSASTDTVTFQPSSSSLTTILRGSAYTFTPQAFTAGTINATTLNATTINATAINGSVAAAQLPVFHASGASHAQGIVPDPGATAGTTRYLREDGTWTIPSGGSTSGTITSLWGFGTSIMYGTGATTPANDSFSLLTGITGGIPAYNWGQAGSSIEQDVLREFVNYQPTYNGIQGIVVESGENNAACSSGGCIAHIKNQFSAYDAWPAIPPQNRILASAANTTTGTWADDSGTYPLFQPTLTASAGVAQKATTSGASKTFNIPSSSSTVVGILYGVQNANTGTFTVSIDGTNVTDNCSGTTTFSSAPCFTPTFVDHTFYRQQYAVTPNTTHTVVVTSTTANAIDFTGVDWIPPANASIVVHAAVLPNFASYATINPLAQAVITQLSGAGLPVYYADMVGGTPGVNTTTDVSGTATTSCPATTTGGHPNDCGQLHYFQTLVNTLSANKVSFTNAAASSGKFVGNSGQITGPLNVSSGGLPHYLNATTSIPQTASLYGNAATVANIGWSLIQDASSGLPWSGQFTEGMYSTFGWGCNGTYLGGGTTSSANFVSKWCSDPNGNSFQLGTTSTRAVMSSGATFTVSGCSATAPTGGSSVGTFTLGANTCTAVVTLAGLTATHGWQCDAHDRTTPTVVISGESASTTTTASFTIPAGAGATDVISFACKGY